MSIKKWLDDQEFEEELDRKQSGDEGVCVHVKGSGEWVWVYVLVFDKGNHVSCVVCASVHAVGDREVGGGWVAAQRVPCAHKFSRD